MPSPPAGLGPAHNSQILLAQKRTIQSSLSFNWKLKSWTFWYLLVKDMLLFRIGIVTKNSCIFSQIDKNIYEEEDIDRFILKAD